MADQDVMNASFTRRRDKGSPWGTLVDRDQQRRDRREAKRNAVLSTAAEMFNERGFHATSLDDIAARLHVTKPTLYYYVKNKDEILLECVRMGLRMTLEGIEASRRAGGRAIDQLRACMEAYGHVVTQPFGMCLIRVGDQEVPSESRLELRRQKSLIDQAFRRLVAAGVAEGSLLPCDPKLTAFTIAGGLSWIGRWYQPDGELSGEDVVRQSVTTLLHGVVAPATASAPGRRRAPQARS
jgi:AcrR family transcriptional regulator